MLDSYVHSQFLGTSHLLTSQRWVICCSFTLTHYFAFFHHQKNLVFPPKPPTKQHCRNCQFLTVSLFYRKENASKEALISVDICGWNLLGHLLCFLFCQLRKSKKLRKRGEFKYAPIHASRKYICNKCRSPNFKIISGYSLTSSGFSLSVKMFKLFLQTFFLSRCMYGKYSMFQFRHQEYNSKKKEVCHET